MDEFERMLQSHVARRHAPTGQSSRPPLPPLVPSMSHREAQKRGRAGMRDSRDETPSDRGSKRCRNDGCAGSPERRRRLDPRQLTSDLSQARGLPELLALQQRHGDDFNGFHVGAFWSRFKTLARGELVGLSERLAPVCEQTVRMLPELNARAGANVAHAFTKAGLVGSGPWQGVWAALPEAVRRGLGGFNAQCLSNTGWAFATAGHEAPALFEAISAELANRQLGGFHEQNVCAMAWAFAVLDPRSADALFSTSFFTTRCTHLETSFALTDLRQLHQWSLWREERGALWPGLPTSLRHACLEAFVAEEGKPSRLQSDVVREIRSRGFDVEEEHRCKVSGYSIDALVTLSDGKKIAVEVDGPSHFLGHSQQPVGATLLKHRQLRYFGWRLESVPYWEWGRSKELHWLPTEPK